MSTATKTKTKASIRRGGPGASHENAKASVHVDKRQADDPQRRHSRVSGAGRAHDSHHTHESGAKGGNMHPLSKGTHA
ncbi:MAG: hypothetical protein WA418_20970 [Bradyrhizobium sp.]